MTYSNITLFGALDSNVGDTYKAKEYLEAQKTQFVSLFYSDPSQIPEVFRSVNSWFRDIEITAFPFLTWDEVTGDTTERKIAVGLKEIKAMSFKVKKPL